MSKCLVTKLKASVNNPDLPIFGEFVINVNYDVSTAHPLDGIKFFSHNTVILPNGTEITKEDSKSLISFKDDLQQSGKIRIKDKYNGLLYINVEGGGLHNNVTFDWGDLKYANLPSIVVSGVNNAASSILDCGKHEETTNLNLLNTSSINEKFKDIALNFPNVANQNIGNSGITCDDIKDIALWTKLNPNSTLFMNYGKFSGNLYDAVVEWRKTSKSPSQNITCYPNTQVFLFDTPCAGKSFKLEWTDTTTSVTIDGVKTTYNNNGNVIS